jgi:isocitrate dehydrogenase (NAD+)
LSGIHKVTLIPGDGIGPSVCEAAVAAIEATGVTIEWEVHQAGLAAIEAGREPLPSDVLESIRNTKVALKGPITTPVAEGYRSVNVSLRMEFDLYANVRPCVAFEGVDSPFPQTDIVIIRENTQGLYTGQDMYVGPEKQMAMMFAYNTRDAMRRISRYALEYARKHNRKRVTAIHKANILKSLSGIFLENFRDIAQEYRDLEIRERIVDAVCMELVRKPYEHDVIVTTNMFGDILSDLAAGLVGGLGLAPGGNYGDEVAIFEAIHGSAPDIAGKNVANPISVMLAGVMMLHHIGEEDAAERLHMAIRDVLKEGEYLTPDLRPHSNWGTTDLTRAVVDHLA